MKRMKPSMNGCFTYTSNRGCFPKAFMTIVYIKCIPYFICSNSLFISRLKYCKRFYDKSPFIRIFFEAFSSLPVVRGQDGQENTLLLPTLLLIVPQEEHVLVV